METFLDKQTDVISGVLSGLDQIFPRPAFNVVLHLRS